ncbi:MAG: type II secretion system GspH family protein [Patescibacteria group bacterium]|nr:type II secretion system GspH family protein [Patescibacteria group bacterium]
MKKSFTLIEILVVATVIGLLASVLTISFSQLNVRARNDRRRVDIEQIRSALEMHRSNNNTYPQTLPTLTPYLSVPSDPKSPTYNYHYRRISDTDYVIGAFFENSSSTCRYSQALSCGSANCNICFGPYGER